MALLPQQVERIRLAFESLYPGIESVEDERLEDEIRYKRATAAEIRERMSRESFEGWLRDGDWEAFVDAFSRITRTSSGLINWRTVNAQSSVFQRNDLDRLAFVRAVFGLLHGGGGPEERLMSFLTELDGLGHRPGAGTLAWVTLFLNAFHPEEVPYVRNVLFEKLRLRLGVQPLPPIQRTMGRQMETYRQAKGLMQDTLEAFRSFGAKDMIDAQSILWVAGSFATWVYRPWEEVPVPNEENAIRLRWNELGDLREVDTKKTLKEIVRRHLEENPDVSSEGWGEPGFRQPWLFAKEARPGHLVAVMPGHKEVRAIARVSGDYHYDSTLPLHHVLPVEWIDFEERVSSREVRGTMFFEVGLEAWADIIAGKKPGAVAELAPLGPVEGRAVDPARDPAQAEARRISLAQIEEATSIPVATLRRWLLQLERKGQAVFFGPPGTGKTFVAEQLAQYLTDGDSERFEMVQFHPSYSYEDFLEGLRPHVVDGHPQYELLPGHFKTFCQRAAQNMKQVHVFLIDELNRAHLSKVFGELMYLLEYRDRDVQLAYGSRFRIPANMRILGTMNTADRSIALVDHALRRRFAFFRLAPDYGPLRTRLNADGWDPGRLIEVLREVNEAIGDPDYEIGHSFFLAKMLPDNPREILPETWQTEIEPYLEEMFHDRPDEMERFRWERIEPRLFAAEIMDPEEEETSGQAEDLPAASAALDPFEA